MPIAPDGKINNFFLFSKFAPYFCKKTISCQNNIAHRMRELNKPGNYLVQISLQFMCLIPTITLFESSVFTIYETWKTTIALDLDTEMDAVKDYISHRLSEFDLRTICLRFMKSYNPIVSRRFIVKFYKIFYYKYFLVKLLPQTEIKFEFWD